MAGRKGSKHRFRMDEHKDKIAEIMKQRVEDGVQKITQLYMCPFCKKEYTYTNAKKHHFNNCKKVWTGKSKAQ